VTSEPPIPACGTDDLTATSPSPAPQSPTDQASPDAPLAPEGLAPRSTRRAYLRDYTETLLVAVLVVLFMTTFVTQNSVIPTPSMEDTLLIGDYLLVNKLAFAPTDAASPTPWLAQRAIRHGDVVVFKFPSDPRTDYIKRVIGLEGDRIEVRDKNVLVNGLLIDEPYKRLKTAIVYPRGTPDGARDNFGPVVVPPDSLFVMGDNRDYSSDSREWSVVPRSHVKGHAFVIFWSRTQRPGSWQIHGLAKLKRFARAFTTFYRDTRWHRLGTIVE
jgi:signal peptidase I